jgi:hypothetical protein
MKGSIMKITFILRNLTDVAIAETAAMEPRAAYDRLHKWAFGDLKHCVAVKFGVNNAFRDRVDANQLLKSDCKITFKIEPRRGYRLATFILA